MTSDSLSSRRLSELDQIQELDREDLDLPKPTKKVVFKLNINNLEETKAA